MKHHHLQHSHLSVREGLLVGGGAGRWRPRATSRTPSLTVLPSRRARRLELFANLTSCTQRHMQMLCSTTGLTNMNLHCLNLSIVLVAVLFVLTDLWRTASSSLLTRALIVVTGFPFVLTPQPSSLCSTFQPHHIVL